MVPSDGYDKGAIIGQISSPPSVSMEIAPRVLVASPITPHAAPAPGPQLLIDWEVGHRVFMGNLADLLLARQPVPARITSAPARFWGDVFVPTGLPWSSFVESMLWHLMVIVLYVWSQSTVWTPVKQFQASRAHQSIVYYPPTPSFPAAQGSASNTRVVKHPSPRQAARIPSPAAPPIHAAAEQRRGAPSLITPPDIRAAAAFPSLPSSHPTTPMAPFSAAQNLRRNAPVEASAVVAPPPKVDKAANRKLAPPQAAVVGPAPTIGETPVDRMKTTKLAAPQAAAVAPAPELARSSPRAKSVPNSATVVPPTPSVPDSGKTRHVQIAGASPQVVPPTASVKPATNLSRATRSNISDAGANAVPPAPTIQGADKTRNGYDAAVARDPRVVRPAPSLPMPESSAHRASPLSASMSNAAPNVVQPAPTVAGKSTVRSAASLAGRSAASTQVVPPAPSVKAANTFSRDVVAAPVNTQPVQPVPSVQAANTFSREAVAAPANAQPVQPAPSVQNAVSARGEPQMGAEVASLPPQNATANAGNASAYNSGRPLEPAPILPTSALPVSGASSSSASASAPNSGSNASSSSSSPSSVSENKVGQETVEELPLGVLGLVWAPPGSSYFSNFEVFVAKRKVGKDQLQLIKLVYEFLPYQKRLSEYDLNNLPPRVIKLRVTPDPSCDETLGRMLEPPTDPSRPVTEYPKLPAALNSYNLDVPLPCYRTSAEDFRKAMSHGH